MEYIAVLGHVVYVMSKNLDGDIWKSCNKSLIMKAGVGLGTQISTVRGIFIIPWV